MALSKCETVVDKAVDVDEHTRVLLSRKVAEQTQTKKVNFEPKRSEAAPAGWTMGKADLLAIGGNLLTGVGSVLLLKDGGDYVNQALVSNAKYQDFLAHIDNYVPIFDPEYSGPSPDEDLANANASIDGMVFTMGIANCWAAFQQYQVARAQRQALADLAVHEAGLKGKFEELFAEYEATMANAKDSFDTLGELSVDIDMPIQERNEQFQMVANDIKAELQGLSYKMATMLSTVEAGIVQAVELKKTSSRNFAAATGTGASALACLGTAAVYGNPAAGTMSFLTKAAGIGLNLAAGGAAAVTMYTEFKNMKDCSRILNSLHEIETNLKDGLQNLDWALQTLECIKQSYYEKQKTSKMAQLMARKAKRKEEAQLRVEKREG